MSGTTLHPDPESPRTRIFILGATGGTGLALVEQARLRGHAVTAFVRSPGKIGPPRDGLTVLRGDPRSPDELADALPGHHAVLSVLGPTGLGPTTLVGDAARATVEAMRATGVQRLLVVGVAVLFEGEGLLPALARRTFLRNVAQDSAEMERVVRASGLDWTIVRPPRLTDGALTRAYAVADGRMPPSARSSISRADVASFLLDELERPAHVGRIVGLASARTGWRQALLSAAAGPAAVLDRSPLASSGSSRSKASGMP